MDNNQNAPENNHNPKGFDKIGNIIPKSLKSFFERLGRRGLTFAAFISAVATGYILASFIAVLNAEKQVQAGVEGSYSFTNVNFVNGVSIARMILITVIAGAVLIAAWALISGFEFRTETVSEIENSKRRRLSTLPIHISLLLTSIPFAYTLAVIASQQMFDKTYSESGTHPHADAVFIVGIAVVMVIIIKYLSSGDKLMIGELSRCRLMSSWKVTYGIVAAGVVIITVFFTVYTYYRYLSFSNSTFDFGIFTQMFENMAKTGVPLTTVERAGETTHFAVHFSPSWYLLLPIYMLFRSPFYLFLANSAVIAIGAFPVFRICKKIGTTPLAAVGFSFVYLLFPTFGAGAFYDIHENSLLPVLILYMVYFFLDEKLIPMLIFTLLTLGDKEDAAIYVAAFALYAIFATKRKWTGVALFFIAVAYFLFASLMISKFGGSIMSSRLNAYYPSGTEKTGFLAPLKTVFADIGYFIKKVFDTDMAKPSSAESAAKMFGDGKLQFVIWMLLPVLFTPFLSKKGGVLFLLVPMVVENLMLTWSYQYDVYYQYQYGPAALIIFASIVAISSMTVEKRRMFLLCSVVLCFIMAGALFWPKASMYETRYKNNKEFYDNRQATIDLFFDEYYEEGDSVATTGSAVPHMSQVSKLRSLGSSYGEDYEADWFVVPSSYVNNKNYSYLNTDYECMNPNDPGDYRIFKKTAQ